MRDDNKTRKIIREDEKDENEKGKEDDKRRKGLKFSRKVEKISFL